MNLIAHRKRKIFAPYCGSVCTMSVLCIACMTLWLHYECTFTRTLYAYRLHVLYYVQAPYGSLLAAYVLTILSAKKREI